MILYDMNVSSLFNSFPTKKLLVFFKEWHNKYTNTNCCYFNYLYIYFEVRLLRHILSFESFNEYLSLNNFFVCLNNLFYTYFWQSVACQVLWYMLQTDYWIICNLIYRNSRRNLKIKNTVWFNMVNASCNTTDQQLVCSIGTKDNQVQIVY